MLRVKTDCTTLRGGLALKLAASRASANAASNSHRPSSGTPPLRYAVDHTALIALRMSPIPGCSCSACCCLKLRSGKLAGKFRHQAAARSVEGSCA